MTIGRVTVLELRASNIKRKDGAPLSEKGAIIGQIIIWNIYPFPISTELGLQG